MRILIISNLYPPNVVGGYERLCFEVTAGLAAQGHEMTVLTSRYGGREAAYPPQTILRELDLLTGADIYTPFQGSAEDRAAINDRNLRTLGRVLETVQPDVVFSWNLFFLDASMLAALEDSRFRTVVMLTDNWLLVMRNGAFVAEFFRDCVHGEKVFVPPPDLRGTWAEEPPARPFPLQRLKAAILGRTGAPQATSFAARGRPPEAIFGAGFMRDLYAAGGHRFARHRIIHNGVKQQAYDKTTPRDRAALVQADTLRLLFAGRLVDLKGAHTAVGAMALLDPAACGVARIELTILGDAQDAAYMQVLNAAIAQSPRAADIVLRPAVPEDALFALFNDHDIYLFPSLYEPFSLTLIHALACGIPTVASDTGGNPEIVTDGESGLLFRKGDPATLADAVTRLAGDAALRVRLAARGQAAARGFTFEKMVGEMVGFLEQPA